MAKNEKTNWVRLLIGLALTIILVVSTITALFGAGEVVNAGLDKLLNVDTYGRDPHYNFRNNISDGLSKFLVALPLAWFAYREIKKLV